MNLGDLSAPRRDRALAAGRRRNVVRGELLYTPGAPVDAAFVVLEGRIKIVRTRPSGAEAIIGIRHPGDVFGEVGALTGATRRTTSAIALEAGVTTQIETVRFLELLAGDAVLAATFARGLARRLASAERDLVEFSGKSVPGRLVDLLGSLAADHGVPGPGGALRIALRLTHQDLADLIGTSRETLTKELAVLADVGLVRVAPREIDLLVPAAFPHVRDRTG